jgi:hypothetical protein
MVSERDFAINAKVSSEAALRLKKLSARRNQSYGEILDSLLLDVPIESADWEQPLADVMSRIADLEAQVSALLSTSTTLPSSHQDADFSGAEGQGISEPGLAEKAPEIALQAAKSAGSNNPSKPTVKAFIADLVAAGERSPARIAKALNQAGYRTGTGSEFQRSNPQIAAALKAKD